MNRRDFMRVMSLIGGVSGSARCGPDVVGLYDDFEVNFDGSVLIVGAGAAGMAAAYLLKRYGIACQVLEAGSRFGGRVRRDDTLAEFPIDLGAEWIHHDPSILASLIDDPTVQGSIDTIVYSPESMASWHRGRVRAQNFGNQYYREYKFRSTTWFGYLETYFAPALEGAVVYNAAVTDIDTTGLRVQARTADGRLWTADRIIVTAPIKVLQEGDITFTPPLPASTTAALEAIDVPEGLKVFVRFGQNFYPDILIDGPALGSASFRKLYYNAAFRKQTSQHVMGLFWVAHEARAFTELDNATMIGRVIDEMDQRFTGRASRHYLDHRIQNWSAEPFIRGAYSVDFFGDQERIVAELKRPVDNRVYFAGEALHIAEQATVHGAMLTAYSAVERLLANRTPPA